MTTSPAVQALKKRHGKRYAQVASLVDRTRTYTPQEAVALVKKTATAKFDETIEVHIRTTADPKRSEQMVRGVVVLPHGVGKPKRVLVFAQGEAGNIARQAGADIIGDDEVIRRIDQEGWTEFDVALATPDMMGRIGRLGRVLGRKGLMPNPRAGTVVPPQDLPRVIAEAKKGRLEFRLDRLGIIHCPIGKASFPEQHLLENLAALVDAVKRAKPEDIKGVFIRSITLTSTMGPGIKLDVPATLALKVE
ncbi:MAG: 50S ribosomal protein L1 [Dehalococcoidia bacterium]|nr:50S ribosomal protein L1 [Dehalococcoidia bacterium]MDW8119039.1 50S ribosomal protein L1 [Chloroflexota bacterium]